jgi:hypothetical protein
MALSPYWRLFQHEVQINKQKRKANEEKCNATTTEPTEATIEICACTHVASMEKALRLNCLDGKFADKPALVV